jgi:hypothetical protein
MTKRTSPDNLNNWDDAPDINRLVQDKRSAKRASQPKAVAVIAATKIVYLILK